MFDVMIDFFCLENVDDEDYCLLLNIVIGVVMLDEKVDYVGCNV